jgi:hypothetical protein
MFAALREKASQVQLISSLSEEHQGKIADELTSYDRRDFAARVKAERIVAALTVKASQVELLSLISQELEEIDSIPVGEQFSLELQDTPQEDKETKVTKRFSHVSPMRKTSEKVCLRRHPTVVKINQHHVRVDSPLSLEDILDLLQQAIRTNN